MKPFEDISPHYNSDSKVESVLNRPFSHIYLEKDAAQYPDAQEVLRKFPHAKVVEINSYKEIFNRPKQDWSLQKETRSLILAVRKDNFLYKGSDAAPNFGFKHFYYNAHALNCIYDCDYCYLQGMYPSANIVFFVNDNDFFAETDRALAQEKPLYLCISYDTDLLALSGILPLAARWVTYAATREDLIIELRTKSSSYKYIKEIPPTKNVILAWTLSPTAVAQAYELRTPPLAARLRSVEEAIQDGWQVRLCFDPLLAIPGGEEIYTNFIKEVFSKISYEKLREVSVGVFRINTDYLRQIQRQREDSPILYYPFEKKEKLSTYPEETSRALTDLVSSRVREYLPSEKIFVM